MLIPIFQKQIICTRIVCKKHMYMIRDRYQVSIQRTY